MIMSEKGFNISLNVTEKTSLNKETKNLMLPCYQHVYTLAQKEGFNLMKGFFEAFNVWGISIESFSFDNWKNEPGCECSVSGEECHCQNISAKILINIKDQYGDFKVEANWYINLDNKMSIKFYSREMVYQELDAPGKTFSEKMITFIKQSLLMVFNKRKNINEHLFDNL